MEPINVPKLFIIGIFAFASLGLLLPNFKIFFVDKYRIYTILSLLFILQMVLVILVSDSPWNQQFFGTFGRNTGLVAYLSLVLLFACGVVSSTYQSTSKLMYALLGAGAFNAIYGVVQWAGLDPIDWQNPYNSILGTLGNPNFASSFLGMSSVVAFALFFDRAKRPWVRVSVLAYSLLALVLAYESDSIQGVLVAGVGLVIVIFALLKKLVVRIGFGLLTLAAMVVAVLGTLQIGPLSKFLYEASVTYRGDYWRAGIVMTRENPLFGVGLDSYGDYYRASRTLEATLRRGPDVTSNSAHNVFLDISATGGLPLIGIYLLMVALVIRSSIRLISRGYRWVAVAAIGAWAAYIVQSVISINQLGLAVWGWILAGTIIGLDLNGDVEQSRLVKVKGRRVDIPASSYLTGVALGVAGLVIAINPWLRDYSFRESLESGDKNRIQEVALSGQISNYYLNLGAKTFLDNKLSQEAQQLLYRAIENNPRDFNAWQQIVAMPETEKVMRDEALKRMRELDPNNRNIPAN